MVNYIRLVLCIQIIKWLDLQPPTISSLNGLYSWIGGIHMSPTKRAILDVISGAVVLWSLWSFRNETIFGTDHPKRNLLFDKIVDYSFRWYSSRCKLHFSFMEQLDSKPFSGLLAVIF
ncbi:hypothetical protein CTI12_AA272880 [Artemisia annua]|uniref:Uncharacterized protein n=1 Tax=Artemisia annua TaxID=35608 RepID=A0A2U1NF96_ARTAN|nr:hypothetical protein CTI12_AA272880 [Artemisia annua]